jgi:methylated-DNA-[protein]-cysteine S-methyltransferase
MSVPPDTEARALLAALPESDAAAESRLRARLADVAQAQDLLDVAYATVDSPVGPLLLAATDHGLVRIAFGVEDHARVLTDLATRIGPRILRSPLRLGAAVGQLAEYFDGHRRSFDLPLDLRLSSGFRRQVIDHLREIAYGRTESYAEVAAAAGSPRAVRAVGTACATNPLPVVVPCHRVLRSDGSLGGYLGGIEAKQALLSLEAA